MNLIPFAGLGSHTACLVDARWQQKTNPRIQPGLPSLPLRISLDYLSVR